MSVAIDEAIDGQLIYEFINQLSEQSVDAKEEEENLLQLHISHVADHLGLKVLWFNLGPVLLHGKNYQAHFGSDQMLYHLRQNLPSTQWCATKEMNIQYSMTPKTSTKERILRHDLVIFNLPCEDADSALYLLLVIRKFFRLLCLNNFPHFPEMFFLSKKTNGPLKTISLAIFILAHIVCNEESNFSISNQSNIL